MSFIVNYVSNVHTCTDRFLFFTTSHLKHESGKIYKFADTGGAQAPLPLSQDNIQASIDTGLSSWL